VKFHTGGSGKEDGNAVMLQNTKLVDIRNMPTQCFTIIFVFLETANRLHFSTVSTVNNRKSRLPLMVAGRVREIG